MARRHFVFDKTFSVGDAVDALEFSDSGDRVEKISGTAYTLAKATALINRLVGEGVKEWSFKIEKAQTAVHAVVMPNGFAQPNFWMSVWTNSGPMWCGCGKLRDVSNQTPFKEGDVVKVTLNLSTNILACSINGQAGASSVLMQYPGKLPAQFEIAVALQSQGDAVQWLTHEGFTEAELHHRIDTPEEDGSPRRRTRGSAAAEAEEKARAKASYRARRARVEAGEDIEYEEGEEDPEEEEEEAPQPQAPPGPPAAAAAAGAFGGFGAASPLAAGASGASAEAADGAPAEAPAPAPRLGRGRSPGIGWNRKPHQRKRARK